MNKNIKAVVFDMDGVLRIGNQLINGSHKVLDY
jgi:ribonucleotide monophosphatase NagD (HAD superfamily)